MSDDTMNESMLNQHRTVLHLDEVARVLVMYNDVLHHNELRALLKLYRRHGITQEYIREVLNIRTCRYGHFLYPKNEYVYPDGKTRQCRECTRRSQRASYRHRRQKADITTSTRLNRW